MERKSKLRGFIGLILLTGICLACTLAINPWWSAISTTAQKIILIVGGLGFGLFIFFISGLTCFGTIAWLWYKKNS